MRLAGASSGTRDPDAARHRASEPGRDGPSQVRGKLDREVCNREAEKVFAKSLKILWRGTWVPRLFVFISAERPCGSRFARRDAARYAMFFRSGLSLRVCLSESRVASDGFALRPSRLC